MGQPKFIRGIKNLGISIKSHNYLYACSFDLVDPDPVPKLEELCVRHGHGVHDNVVLSAVYVI